LTLFSCQQRPLACEDCVMGLTKNSNFPDEL
jgi:hypothetical protein